ncbi:GNAT family N-acetyltransferase [Georgenia sp. Z1491]|uniref:GNAT family N-acetyltransferase n=1 Tax=Georgenia sp. Z1491 TaxID=3416707 RepID=UPI003CEA18F1
MSTEFTHEPARSRYVTTVDGVEAGEATYVLEGDMHVFDHTFTDPKQRGQGLAGRLVEFALTDVRERGGMVRPVCPFVVDYMDAHPEFADIRA